ncbi:MULTISPECIES: hypothetical protein [unclassified Bradyrhizobium]|uniref:hypothetical protein n=1 Tax=unclassified Bradyrhizobium TaxID=2631580 RepID=UPI001FFB2400|nr:MULTISPECIES: hypothetical protein [unclassified Bradyrhizobium]MCK1294523.1 hypothetical protein [Bradyrhizobium sp. 30]MCK1305332.1 hypothetical protein [Bradyrhizobium sp. 45]MCK1318367.1 hypothetical protein [Bradyrhizobium sp. 23]MCK1439945.1 hypothetical protein [Bradyrhizobium sp. 15]MCK1508019.1 hypothetical protein [Bradyrhizobium sp. 18]
MKQIVKIDKGRFALGSDEIVFVRGKRRKPEAPDPSFTAEEPQPLPRRAQLVKVPTRPTLVRVPNRPARFPVIWPEELTAETLAAFLDFPTTRELCKSISRGEAPAPTSFRRAKGTIQCVWHKHVVLKFVAARHAASGE